MLARARLLCTRDTQWMRVSGKLLIVEKCLISLLADHHAILYMSYFQSLPGATQGGAR